MTKSQYELFIWFYSAFISLFVGLAVFSYDKRQKSYIPKDDAPLYPSHIGTSYSMSFLLYLPLLFLLSFVDRHAIFLHLTVIGFLFTAYLAFFSAHDASVPSISAGKQLRCFMVCSAYPADVCVQSQKPKMVLCASFFCSLRKGYFGCSLGGVIRLHWSAFVAHCTAFYFPSQTFEKRDPFGRRRTCAFSKVAADHQFPGRLSPRSPFPGCQNAGVHRSF